MRLAEVKFWCKKLHTKTLIIFTLTGLLLLSIAVAAVFGGSLNVAPGFGASSAVAAPQVFQDELQIQLGSNGFTPSEVQHAAGTFAIAVENLAISGEYTLRLKAEDGTVVKEIQVQKGSAGWTVTLSAGQYTLSETNHPQWVCRITVQ